MAYSDLEHVIKQRQKRKPPKWVYVLAFLFYAGVFSAFLIYVLHLFGVV